MEQTPSIPELSHHHWWIGLSNSWSIPSAHPFKAYRVRLRQSFESNGLIKSTKESADYLLLWRLQLYCIKSHALWQGPKQSWLYEHGEIWYCLEGQVSPDKQEKQQNLIKMTVSALVQSPNGLHPLIWLEIIASAYQYLSSSLHLHPVCMSVHTQVHSS